MTTQAPVLSTSPPPRRPRRHPSKTSRKTASEHRRQALSATVTDLEAQLHMLEAQLRLSHNERAAQAQAHEALLRSLRDDENTIPSIKPTASITTITAPTPSSSGLLSARELVLAEELEDQQEAQRLMVAAMTPHHTSVCAQQAIAKLHRERQWHRGMIAGTSVLLMLLTNAWMMAV
jgi:Tfp pilus assembly protein FimV